MKTKRIVIIEGVDASGKSKLCNHLKLLANGKCHILHSNYNKKLPKTNHRRQHKLICKFAYDNFKNSYYTGNNLIILDRCYISDIAYGLIGYGSKGTLIQKFNYLDSLFKLLTKNKNVEVDFIYCRPEKSKFNKNEKDELLTEDENSKMQKIYDSTIFSYDFHSIIKKYNIRYYEYDFNLDPNYVILDKEFNYFN